MKNKKVIIIFTVLLFFLSMLVVSSETYLYNSNEISYDNSNSTLVETNVQDALDELYNRSITGDCPNGYTCTNKTNIICKRATSLRTELCEQTSSSDYCSKYEGNGNIITYGNLGKHGILTPGDAFDCKVSTTGGYSERFYYVSNYYDTTTGFFNDSIAVLIYYTNTINGIPNESDVSTYNTSPGTIYDGPVTAASHLPTTSQWNNISLYKENRQILDVNNKTSTSNGNYPLFNYSGKAARLLTNRELNTLYTTTNIENRKFLYENTNYSSPNKKSGSWLETPSVNENYVVNLVGTNLSTTNSNYQNRYSVTVRPVIEIPKSQIEY